MFSPYVAFVRGQRLVVDGRNCLRRHLVMPEFTQLAAQVAGMLR
jgi:hypothetical protein